MSRVTGWTGQDGVARSAASVNTTCTAIETASASLDGTNFAAEGLDSRNVDAQTIVEMETAGGVGGRPCFVAKSTSTAFQGDGITDYYRNETTTPMVVGTAVELDWTGNVLTLAADEYLEILGVVHYGTTDTGFETATASNGVSCAILVDPNDGGGYDLITSSRQGLAGYAWSVGSVPAAGDQIVGDAFDLTPTHIVASGSVKKIALVQGLSMPGTTWARVSSAQIVTTVKKRVR